MTAEEKVTVHYALNEIDAQTAAGALRANKLHPLVWRDPYDVGTGMTGVASTGRFVVIVPRSEELAARRILQPRRRRRRP